MVDIERSRAKITMEVESKLIDLVKNYYERIDHTIR